MGQEMKSPIRGQIKRFIGAISSNHPAARLGILIKAISPLSNSVDKIIYKVRSIENSSEYQMPPCLMIVSPPRAGGTIIYQVLTRIIPSVYISNLHRLLPGFASIIMHKTGKFGTNLTGYNNYYGYTTSLYDVNEGNELVDKWFKGEINREIIRERFKKFVKMMRASQDLPLIFKNVRNYKNILNLHQAIPELIFLRVTRNPEQIIQSELKAFYELGTFHPIPEALAKIPINDPIDFCVKQILEIENKMNEQKKHIPQENWMEWSYEDFCNNTIPMIRELAGKYFGMKSNHLREDNLIESLHISNRSKVNEHDAKRISMLINTYYPNSMA
jgi:hypothetical protein